MLVGDRFPKIESPWAISPGQTASVDTRRPCPCCGHLVFDIEDGWPGSFAICPICFWEDDAQQFRWPFMPGGAHRVSLVEGAGTVRRSRKQNPEGLCVGVSGGGGLYAIEDVPFLLA
ncbi:CPCC family cysteine-rich protein [Streptomyces sp. NPDC004012]